VAVDGKRRQNLGNHCLKFSNKESCNMASEIAIIKVPAPIVTLQQFAELEGVSERTAYTTGLELEVKLSDVEYESEDNEG